MTLSLSLTAIPFATMILFFFLSSRLMPPQATVIDPLIQLLTGSSGSEGIRYEDHYETNCLNLNIYMPSQVPTNAKLPVMVFIFGGGL